ncbi:MAG: tRNA 2-thiouridine(34) synthase MnmA [Natronospirillum sp.]
MAEMPHRPTASNPAPEDTKVIVGMSGGVDSSVSALLLQQQGYRVEGLFMKNWEEDDGTEYCTAREDLADAQAVCDRLGIKLHTANFAAEYWDNVFEHFLHEYRVGRTPNPDILCNREIKFKAFLDYAKKLGADRIATGHYVRKGFSTEGHAALVRGLDRNKDQSYFLHQVGHEQLALTLFPVGDLEKPVVRQLAEAHHLITHDKKDSTGICFIGERRFSDFLQQYLPAQPGRIETPEGDVIGEHNGLMYYTIGQRQGMRIGGLKDYPEAPWFAAAKDLQRNVLVAVQGDHPMLYTRQAKVNALFWIDGQEPDLTSPLTCKHRYRQEDQDCQLMPDGTGYRILFTHPQRAVTPGQSAVLYQGERCLGGGVIEEAWH